MAGILGRVIGAGALIGGGSLLNKYAQGNFQNDGSKRIAGMISGGMKLGGAYLGLRAGSRVVGGSANSLSGLIGGGFGSNQYRAGAAAAMGGLGKTLSSGGMIDNLLAKANPASLAFRGAKLAGRAGLGIAKSPINAVAGARQYASATNAAIKQGRRHGFTAGWSSLYTGFGSVENEFAPWVWGGIAAGGVSAFTRNYSPNGNGGFSQNRMTTPNMAGNTISTGPRGPVNASNFGGGISMGRSGITSPTVMGGQAAVVNKMVKQRRV